MFFKSIARVSRSGLVRQTRKFGSEPTGTWPKTVEAFPKHGQSHGGHPNTLQSEGNVYQTWINQPAAWPILVITAGALVFATYKALYVDAMAPEVHFSTSDRRTFNYIENDVSAQRNRIFMAPAEK